MVYCVKLQKEADSLDKPPFPGPLGEKIFNSISKEAWLNWQAHQTMLINENRLSLIDPEARQYLKNEMERYFFGGGSELPAGFIKPE
jgi:Fe-S cluster biosynthesis and repair protein YggX